MWKHTKTRIRISRSRYRRCRWKYSSFLWLADKKVTYVLPEGKHLNAIINEGLKLKSTLKGQHNIPIHACNAEDYSGKADVIFVRKGYSIDSITELIKKAAHKNTHRYSHFERTEQVQNYKNDSRDVNV